MRIIHLNTDDSRGGAARAAIRLHRALLTEGHDSTFLVRKRSGLHDGVPHIVQASDEPDPAYARLIQEWYIDHRLTDASQTIFSGGMFGVPVNDHPIIRDGDVLNLHWVAGFLTPIEIGNLLDLKKRIVWTLHDQWPMTGGCHYAGACRQFAELCRECPQLDADEAGLVPASFLDRLQSFGSRITAVTPSEWMALQARASRIFRDARIETIPNSVDHNVFKPLVKKAVREKLGIPADAFVPLFACSAAFEKRKGVPLFRALLKELGTGVSSLFVGWRTESENGPNEKHFGFVNDDSALCDIYNAADVLVHVASEDNLPNMPLEAMACGTPVLGLKTGGLPEIVEHQVSGLLISSSDFNALVEAARGLMRDQKLCAAYGAASRRRIEEKFTPTTQARRYAALYSETVADSRPQSREHHVAARICELLSISGDLRLAAEEKRVREELAPTLTALRQEKERLERQVRRIERNVGYRAVSGLANGLRSLGRALRGKRSGLPR